MEGVALFYSEDQERQMPNKQRHLPLWKKYEIVSGFNHDDAENVYQLTKEHEMPKPSLQTILSNKDKVVSEFGAVCNAEIKKQKHIFGNANEPLM